MQLLFGRSPLSSPKATTLELGEILSKPQIGVAVGSSNKSSLMPSNVSAFSSLSGTDCFSLMRDWPTANEMQLAHDNFKANEASQPKKR